MPLHPGDAVRVEMTKWVDRPHWAFDATYLGDDEHGDWIGITVGTPMARPGARFVTEVAQVGLIPRDAGWVATFHAPGYAVATYVDMTSRAWWDDSSGSWVCRCVDLDLDVIRTAEGHVYVDDEDEFAEHRVRYGYPPEIVTLAVQSCSWVLDRVLREQPPFDGASSDRWFAVLAGLGG